MGFETAFEIGFGAVLGIGFGVWVVGALLGVDLLSIFKKEEDT